MKILLIRFTALGDVAMLAPIVREVAEQRPHDEFHVMSMPFCAPLFDEIAPNVNFIGRNIKKDYKGIPGIYRLFKELDAMRFDFVCDMHDVLRTKVLRLLFRIHGYKVFKINKHRAFRKEITAPEGKKVLRQLPTSFDNYREVLRNVFPDLKECDYEAISTKGNSPVKRIGIAPFAAHEGKIFPIGKMEQLVSLLSRDVEDVFLFGGGGKEKETMTSWAEKYAHVHLASETHKGLREELKLMKTLDVMLSMDSANMHLASLVGTRVVSIWGATHPYAGFLGWRQSQDDCVQLDLPCRPCSIYGNKPCLFGDHRCMKNITPEMVRNKVLQ